MFNHDDTQIKANIETLKKAGIEFKKSDFSKTSIRLYITLNNGFSIEYNPFNGNFRYKSGRYKAKTAKGVINFIKKKGLHSVKNEGGRNCKNVQKMKINYKLQVEK